MVYAAHFVGVLACGYPMVWLLRRARWTWHHPRIAILCWQAVALALVLSVIGLPLAIGLEPYPLGTGAALLHLAVDLATGAPLPLDPTRLALVAAGLTAAAALIGVHLHSAVRTARLRRRHRHILTLVARDDPAAPGAKVLDHPSAAAYCLPGLRPSVVVSAGTLSLLNRPQLAAVLSHEQAHATERHDLVLLPFTALARLLPWARSLTTARDAVALLIELRADDRARRRHGAHHLAEALHRFTSAGPRTPPGALGIADPHITLRLHRLRTPTPLPWARATLTALLTAALLAQPLALYAAPF